MRQFGVIWGLGNVNTFHAVEGPGAAIAATQVKMVDTSTSRRTDSVRIDSPLRTAPTAVAIELVTRTETRRI